MLYLILNIILSSFFILAMRWIQGRDEDILNVGAINYIVGGIVGLAMFLADEGKAYSLESCATGAVMGTAYFVAFFFLLSTMEWKGAALAAVVARLSILMPVLCGILLWSERPSGFQWLGIVLACVSLTLIGQRGVDLNGAALPRRASLIIGGFFAIAGSARLAQEAFRHIAEENQKPSFLLVAFGVASVGSIAMLVARRRRPSLPELGFGTLIGLANVSQTFFILKALDHFDGFIVFPVTSAGGLLFTTLVAALLLKERLAALTWMGIGLAVLALFLLQANIG